MINAPTTMSSSRGLPVEISHALARAPTLTGTPSTSQPRRCRHARGRVGRTGVAQVPDPRSRGPCARMATRRVAGWGGGLADRIAAPRPTRRCSAPPCGDKRRGYADIDARVSATAGAVPSRRSRVGRTASRRSPIRVAGWGGGRADRIAAPRPTRRCSAPHAATSAAATRTSTRRVPGGVVAAAPVAAGDAQRRRVGRRSGECAASRPLPAVLRTARGHRRRGYSGCDAVITPRAFEVQPSA